ncbi:MAG: cytochrome P450, partial [Candidatus Binatia bacterium]
MTSTPMTAERFATIEPGLPPGPSAPALWQVIRLWRRPQSFLEGCRRRYGDAFTLRFPMMPPEVFVCEPEAVRDLFTGDTDTMRAGEANVILEPILGRSSLLLLDGDRHLRERRLMMPPFHGERMHHYADIIRGITREAMSRWPVGRPFAVQPEMQRITLEVILRAVFGVDDAERLADLRHSLTRLLAVGTNPTILARWLQIDLGPLSPWGRYVRVRRQVHGMLLAEIARRRAGGTAGRVDVLSMLLEARDENGEPMSDEELRDEMITLLLAGHETTATALSWT